MPTLTSTLIPPPRGHLLVSRHATACCEPLVGPAPAARGGAMRAETVRRGRRHESSLRAVYGRPQADPPDASGGGDSCGGLAPHGQASSAVSTQTRAVDLSGPRYSKDQASGMPAPGSPFRCRGGQG